MENKNLFPSESARKRLARYKTNDLLFTGEHRLAFNAKIDDDRYSEAYQKLRYIVANFAGLISKVSADFLMGEMLKARWESDDNREWSKALFFENRLHRQFYESSLLNSRRGDAVLKIRTGFLRSGDTDLSLIMESISPSIYFPRNDADTLNGRPAVEELAWKVKANGNEYVRKEIHEAGKIRNELWLLKGDEIVGQSTFGTIGLDVPEEVDTGISRSLLVHIPNWNDGTKFWGYDDYDDLLSLFYAMNNRLTKTDNILDQHADPILALPEGVLDEDGKVKREALKMVEIPNVGQGAGQGKPEYITWNAQLESVWKELEKLQEMLYMFSETSPAAFGMDKQGAAESGRALKLRLMRTLAKINRKRIYYDTAIKEALVVAQELAKAQGVGVMGMMPGEVEIPELEWQDGIPNDYVEMVETEAKRIDAGLTSAKSSIMRMDGVDEDEADKELERIEEESTVTAAPGTSPTGGFLRNDRTPDNQPDDRETVEA